MELPRTAPPPPPPPHAGASEKCNVNNIAYMWNNPIFNGLNSQTCHSDHIY